ncbi:TetR family transcriptional regulator [Ktedonospora formicarum]|uniref:TetR family transcriptional regulator n=1 Tax=Ktedonospora formicarum TaxID=2778364 RepID=A0A8J3IDD6_9CHLR|nr:TetR family transcriptional regulator [Ktedonospora formicarum]
MEEGARSRAKREQILEGARHVFLREGFAAASTDTLAREAGVSKRTLYAYYPGKEELFVDVVRRFTIEHPRTRVLDFIQGARPRTSEELHGTILMLAQKVIDSIMRSKELAILRAIIADSHRFPQLTETLRSTIPERATLEVSLMLERARANGVAIQQGDTKIMSRMLIGPILSYVLFDGLLRPEPQPPDIEKLKEIVNMFMKAILV